MDAGIVILEEITPIMLEMLNHSMKAGPGVGLLVTPGVSCLITARPLFLFYLFGHAR